MEEVVEKIKAKGEEIKAIKTAKPPTMKDDLAPLVADLLALKVSYKEITGNDYDPPKAKKEKGPAQTESQREGPSKTELNKLKKKEAKEKAKAAERAAKEAAGLLPSNNSGAKAASTEDDDAALAHLYGDSPLIRSEFITEKSYKEIAELPQWVRQTVWVRARLHSSRSVGKGIFIVLRKGLDTVQGIVWESAGKVPKAMVKYAQHMTLESVVDILCTVDRAQESVQSCSIKDFELKIHEIHIVSKAQDLPFQIVDAARSEEDCEKTGLPSVAQDTSLNYRWIDLRTPANNAIFKIESAVGYYFREFLHQQNFIEIHTPKLIGGASEGGANVFTLDYFGRPACLAQSPQLYKQIAAACSGFDRVMEVGPVFRAENSNTHRHLCEFVGLDFEMVIIEHYYEVLDLMGNLFCYIFDKLKEHHHHELTTISQQYPFEPLRYTRPTLRITFEEGITMLREAGWKDAAYDEDIGTTEERALGKLVADKYGTDFYIMDKYPLSARPFYTMPDPENPNLSNSYDLFIRGEEIVSGAQRIHDADLLTERAKAMDIPVETIQSYVDAFKNGALPHGGGGIGLERVVMLFLGLKNIRKASMFPRDPNRLSP